MWLKLVLISFLFCGISDTMWKIAGETGGSYTANTYIFIFHISALIGASIAAIKMKKKITRNEFFLGVIAGFSIVIGSICSMKAILRMPGIIYFPVSSGGSLLFVTIMAHILWKEKISLRQTAGLMVAIISIILISTK